MAVGYDISLAASSSASAANTAPFNVTGGGGRQNWIPWVVIGVVVLLALTLWLRKGKG